MNKEFLNFVEELMKANPDLATQLRTPNIDIYLDTLRNEPEKPVLTENGKAMLKVLQDEYTVVSFKAADIAESMGVTSRGASGTLRKLVTDGFCDKIGKDPITYTLTEKGKNFIITD